MTSKFKTRDVGKAHYANFLKKAQECFHAARNSFANQEWNAAAINAIHCTIAACDAMCVYPPSLNDFRIQLRRDSA